MSYTTLFFAERFWCPLIAAGGVVCVTPSGELDVSTVPTLDEALRHAQTQGELIILDLAALDFMDTSGVRLLAAATRRIRWGGGRLALEAVPAHIDRLLRRCAT